MKLKLLVNKRQHSKHEAENSFKQLTCNRDRGSFAPNFFAPNCGSLFGISHEKWYTNWIIL